MEGDWAARVGDKFGVCCSSLCVPLQIGGDAPYPEDTHMDTERAAAEGFEPLPRTPGVWMGLRYEVSGVGWGAESVHYDTTRALP